MSAVSTLGFHSLSTAMSSPKGTLSYWNDGKPENDGDSLALYVRNTKDDGWLMVGIYEKEHLNGILRTTYANWPKGMVYFHQLP